MSDSVIDVTGIGNLSPDWLDALQGAVRAARKAGWKPTTGRLVFEGYPYIWRGEPKTSTWTLSFDENEEIEES